MNPDNLCICGHTYEVHFGHDCSELFRNGTACPCKQFVHIGLAVPIFEALKLLCDACDLFIHDLGEAEAIAPAYEAARELISKSQA